MSQLDDLPPPTPNKQSLVGDVCINLISLLRDGAEFCSAAVHEAKDVRVSQLCRQLTDVREAAIVRLTPYAIPSQADLPDDESLVGWAERAWVEIRAMVGDTDRGLLEHLLVSEDRTLEQLGAAESGLPEGEACDVVRQLHAEFSELRQAVGELRELAQTDLGNTS